MLDLLGGRRVGLRLRDCHQWLRDRRLRLRDRHLRLHHLLLALPVAADKGNERRLLDPPQLTAAEVLDPNEARFARDHPERPADRIGQERRRRRGGSRARDGGIARDLDPFVAALDLGLRRHRRQDQKGLPWRGRLRRHGEGLLDHHRLIGGGRRRPSLVAGKGLDQKEEGGGIKGSR